MLASRLHPGANLLGAPPGEVDVVTAPELALRIDEIAGTFRAVGGHTLGLECASRVASETGGWAGPVHQLAVHSRLVDPDALEAVVEVTVQGDFAATLLEDALRTLPPTVALALEHASDLAAIEFAECTRLLGADGATELLRALDSGDVMHVIEQGRRVVPPILRRHLRARAGRPPSEIRVAGADGRDRRAGSRIDGPPAARTRPTSSRLRSRGSAAATSWPRSHSCGACSGARALRTRRRPGWCCW